MYIVLKPFGVVLDNSTSHNSQKDYEVDGQFVFLYRYNTPELCTTQSRAVTLYIMKFFLSGREGIGRPVQYLRTSFA